MGLQRHVLGLASFERNQEKYGAKNGVNMHLAGVFIAYGAIFYIAKINCYFLKITQIAVFCVLRLEKSL